MTAHPKASHPGRAGFAYALSRRLGLELAPPNLIAPSGRPVLAVGAPEARRGSVPTVVPTSGESPAALARGSAVVCGVRDAQDAAAVAIADALGAALGLMLVLVRVSGPGPTMRSLARIVGVEIDQRSDEERGVLAVHGAARAAGVASPAECASRVMHGAPGPALAVAAALERAAFAVVGTTAGSRGLPRVRSTTRHLLRVSPCPVVLCPPDPACAMRLREALGTTGFRTSSGS